MMRGWCITGRYLGTFMNEMSFYNFGVRETESLARIAN